VHDEHLLHQCQRIRLLTVEQVVEQIALAQDADDFVDVATADDDLLVPAGADFAQQRFAVVVGVDPHDLRAWRHHVADAATADADGALDHLLLDMVQQAGATARRDQHLQFLRRVQGLIAGARPQADQTQQQIPQAVEQGDRRPQQDAEQCQRAHHPQRRALGALQRHALGHQFA
jgi:hypothetical protein